MKYKALQNLWTPAGSGYGKSATTTPTLKDQEVLAYEGAVGSGPGFSAPALK